MPSARLLFVRTAYSAHTQDFIFPEKFEIVLNTTDEERPKIFINAGLDLELAKEMLVELHQHLSSGDNL